MVLELLLHARIRHRICSSCLQFSIYIMHRAAYLKLSFHTVLFYSYINGNEWKWMKMNENGWKLMKINENYIFERFLYLLNLFFLPHIISWVISAKIPMLIELFPKVLMISFKEYSFCKVCCKCLQNPA